MSSSPPPLPPSQKDAFFFLAPPSPRPFSYSSPSLLKPSQSTLSPGSKESVENPATPAPAEMLVPQECRATPGFPGPEDWWEIEACQDNPGDRVWW